MKAKLDKEEYEIDCGGIPVIIDDVKPLPDPAKRRKRVITIVVILFIIGLGFWVIQSGMKYTANSAYKAGAACCKDIWRQAEEISESEGLPLEGEISPESPIGQMISGNLDINYGEKASDFRVCCKDGRIYMVVCNTHGRKLTSSDIRFHTKDEQIKSLSSVFTRGKTIACITQTDFLISQNIDD